MSQRNTPQELSSNDTIIVERHYIPRHLYEEWYHPNTLHTLTPDTTPDPNVMRRGGRLGRMRYVRDPGLGGNFFSNPRTTQPQPQPLPHQQFNNTTTESVGNNSTSTQFPNTTTPTTNTPTTNNTTQRNGNFSYYSRNFGQPQSSGSGILPSGLRYSFENYDLPNIPNNNMGDTINPGMTNNTTNTNQTANRSLFRFFAGPELLNMVNNHNNTDGYVPSEMEESFLNYFDELIGRRRQTQPRGLTEDEVNDVCVLSRFNVNDDNESITCPICVAPYEDNEEIYTLLSCNHNFHKTCLTRWLQNHNTCPLCRTNVREYQTNNADTNTNTNTNTNTYTNTNTNTNSNTNYGSINNVEENGIDSLD